MWESARTVWPPTNGLRKNTACRLHFFRTRNFRRYRPDVWKEKTLYGKKSMGVVRTTYLIDEDGIIVRAMDKVKAAQNPAQMLEIL